MAKRILTIFGLSCLLCANATVQYMTVEKLDGSKYSFLLSINPVVTHENGLLVVDGNAATSYTIGDIRNFHFTETDESDCQNQTANTLCIVSLDESTLQVRNAGVSEKVRLVNISGMVVSSAIVDNDGSAVVALPEQKGVYVLTVGPSSIKVIRK